MKIFSLTFFLSLLFSFAFSQNKTADVATGKNDTIKVYATRDFDGKWIPWIPLADLPIQAQRTFRSPEARYQYDRLKYNVLKVLPYAMFARKRYSKLNQDLALTSNKKEQRKLVRACDKEIKDMFNREIKDMSIYQGEILIKLIDRETGKSTYDLVREIKGGVAAFLYQSVARVAGHNLKHQYNPQEERDIEAIIEASGYNNPSLYN
ncbi:MAG: DUF4294 domain-containing protein [Sphingobacteriaceae bacterium]|nr:DUF4294 domain-containing protein [Sphingobacteriaceae bacterium]